MTRGNQRGFEVERLDRWGPSRMTERDVRLERIAARRRAIPGHPLHVAIAGIAFEEGGRVSARAIPWPRCIEHSHVEIDQLRCALDRHPHRAAAHPTADDAQAKPTLSAGDLTDPSEQRIQIGLLHELLQQRDVRQIVAAIEYEPPPIVVGQRRAHLDRTLHDRRWWEDGDVDSQTP